MGKIFGNSKGEEDAVREAAALADRTARETERQRAASVKAQQEMEANFNTDLRGENKATVIAGGTAEALGVGDDSIRKRRQASGLSSTLGVNV